MSIDMLDDVVRLDKRASNLQGHFDLTIKDMHEIRISSDKIVKKGEKIENLHFSEEPTQDDLESKFKAESDIAGHLREIRKNSTYIGRRCFRAADKVPSSR